MSGGVVGWVLNQPLTAVALFIATVIGWPLIVLPDRLIAGPKG